MRIRQLQGKKKVGKPISLLEFYQEIRKLLNTQIFKLKQLNFSIAEINNLEVVIGIEYITENEAEKMMFQAELLMAQGVKVFDKGKKGISRYKNFFNAYDNYQKLKNIDDNIEPIIIEMPEFLKDG